MKTTDNSFMDFFIYGECMVHTDKNGKQRSITPFTEEYEINLSKFYERD